MSNAKELFSALWSAADEMRAKMSADVYKDYLLGLVFYKSLSDKYLASVADLLENRHDMSMDEAQKLYEQTEKEGQEDWEDLCEELKNTYGCFIQPQYTFTAFYNQINSSEFRLENLKQAFREIEKSQGSTYDGLFDDFDIQSKDLGKNPMECNMTISAVIKALSDINFAEYGDDALGDAYEYLIAQFASESGKKAGEFYTPQAVSKIIAKIVTNGREKKQDFSIYDPCCGSGSLLLQIKNCMYREGNKDYSKFVQFFGQEINNQTYNLARMNMMLHRVPPEYQHLNNGDTLSTDWPVEEPTNFDACAMNPPYSLKWNALDSLMTDNRFQHYERLAPKSTADYAFLLHGFYHLKTDGVMGIVLPHGVLFRGGQKELLENI
ncbi:MAG: class I SAM-dependent DNA methyltransferase [Succinatimonas sp.]|nr:class I SAM-dependent DNA methyltransferase [Succinatimonas sp.]